MVASLKPLQDTIFELKSDVKVLNERLIVNREKYAEDIHALTLRMEKIEDYINSIEPKSNVCQVNFNNQISTIKSSVKTLENDLQIIILIAKNPRIALSIAIGLYLFGISDIFPKIIKAIF